MLQALIENALEILYLCLSAGFLALAFFVSRALYFAIKLMKKVNDLTDLTIHYVNKPLKYLVSVENQVNKVVEKFLNK